MERLRTLTKLTKIEIHTQGFFKIELMVLIAIKEGFELGLEV